MAGEGGQFGYEIICRDAASAILKQVQAQLKANDETAKKTDSTVKGHSETVANLARNVMGAVAAYFSFQKGVQLVTTAINEARDAELKFAGLKFTYGDRAKGMKNYTDSLEAAKLFGDDNVASTLSLGKALSLTGSSMMSLIPIASDYTSYLRMGKDSTANFEASMQLLGRAMNGQVTMLERSGIRFTDAQKKILETKNESARLAVIMDVLGKSMGGATNAFSPLLAGATDKAKNSIADYLEEIGAVIIQGTNAAKVTTDFSTAMWESAAEIKKNRAELSELTGFTIDLWKNLSVVYWYYKLIKGLGVAEFFGDAVNALKRLGDFKIGWKWGERGGPTLIDTQKSIREAMLAAKMAEIDLAPTMFEREREREREREPEKFKLTDAQKLAREAALATNKELFEQATLTGSIAINTGIMGQSAAGYFDSLSGSTKAWLDVWQKGIDSIPEWDAAREEQDAKDIARGEQKRKWEQDFQAARMAYGINADYRIAETFAQGMGSAIDTTAQGLAVLAVKGKVVWKDLWQSFYIMGLQAIMKLAAKMALIDVLGAIPGVGGFFALAGSMMHQGGVYRGPAHGGINSSEGYYKLTSGEGVVRRTGMDRLGEKGLSDLNSGKGLSTFAPVFHIAMTMTGSDMPKARELAEQIGPEISNYLKREINRGTLNLAR